MCRQVNEAAIVISAGEMSSTTTHHQYSFTTSSAAKILSHSGGLEISLICTSCIPPAHQSCRPETERLHVRFFAPIVSMSSLAACNCQQESTYIALSKPPSVFKPQYARSARISYMHSRVPVHLFVGLFSYLAWLLERARVIHAYHAIEIVHVFPRRRL